jgi:hypothetical protein
MSQGAYIQIREEDNSMQMPDSYIRADENSELPRGEERAQNGR